MDTTPPLIQSLRQAGLRLTPQRAAVCGLLAASDNHPTAQMIFDQLRPEYPSLSLTTVYNTLEALVRLGAVNVLNNVGDVPTRYDANTAPHAHLLCIQCQRLVDFASPHVAALDAEAAAQSRYQLLGSYLLYYGLCPNCQEEPPA